MPPIKTLVTEFLSSLAGSIASYMSSRFVAGVVKCVLFDSTEVGLLKACAWFPFADFALYSFVVINLSHEYD